MIDYDPLDKGKMQDFRETDPEMMLTLDLKGNSYHSNLAASNFLKPSSTTYGA